MADEARDQFGNLKCPVQGCKRIIRALTGLQELMKMQKHFARCHRASINIREALEYRARHGG